ncbi:MAG: glycosyltransferase [Lachnospiraceae bacterium]|jgi:glycosyltransferase involved in cell wall biosynthesis|nr:glycosyltransferase [Lachnospiraceae bacterium]
MRNPLRFSNLRKTLYYLRKNGLKSTYYAAKERTVQEIRDSYAYTPPSEEELAKQREKSAGMACKISVVVPVYDPKPEHFRAMLESVAAQSYPHYELILADAGESGEAAALAGEFALADTRVKYIKLRENKGISGNTNLALHYTTGEYVGLLDHDDLLTPDALYVMAEAIESAARQGERLELLYSDEDKITGDSKLNYDLHTKPELNLDLLLSNNYICHFLVMKRETIRTLELRSAYDGAQDYDLLLRALDMLLGKGFGRSPEELRISLKRAKEDVCHIGKVLYHWRCHAASTAENPGSKEYAYEAGKRAIEDYLRYRGYNGSVAHTAHLGFYRIEYLPDLITQRPEVGVIGGRLLNKQNKITGGIYLADGTPLYHGLPKDYSGYMHRAAMRQEAEAVDVRCLIISPLVEEIFEDVIGLPYLINPHDGRFDWRGGLKPEADFKRISLEFCEKVRAAGFTIVWDPSLTTRLKQ